jgi:hypothetical protein
VTSLTLILCACSVKEIVDEQPHMLEGGRLRE